MLLSEGRLGRATYRNQLYTSRCYLRVQICPLIMTWLESTTP